MKNTAKWLQIIVSTSADHTEAVSELLESLGALAVTLQDGADEALFETVPHSQSQWQTTKIIGLFENDKSADALGQQFAQQCAAPIPSFEIELLEDDVWERRCLEHVKPMQFGKRLWIYPSWSEDTPPDDARVVSLDPGMAFGTGTHPTTSLCLEWIDSCNFNNKTVIDYGCGSGILAIAAIKCGASHVHAVDHDDQALIATADNAEKNDCRQQIKVYLPDQLDIGPADIVFANILSGPLINLAETLAAVCSTNGYLILSGLLSEQYDAMHTAYSPWFELKPPQEKEGWLLIECRKRQPMNKTDTPKRGIEKALRNHTLHPHGQPDSPRRSLWWIPTILILIALLAVQLSFSFQHQLRAYPATQPWLELLCKVLPCDQNANNPYQSLRIISREVIAHPSAAEAVRVNATFINQNDKAIAFPTLGLSFKNIDGQIIAQREFSPKEYLTDDLDINTGMPSQQLIRVSLDLVDPGETAVAFEFQFSAADN